MLVFFGFWVRCEAKEQPRGCSQNGIALIATVVPAAGRANIKAREFLATLPE